MNFVDIKPCPLCGKAKRIVQSNNPIVAGVCEDCLNEQFDYTNLKQANFFCRTYNLPWHPDKWCTISKEAKQETFYEYVTVIKDEYPHSLYNEEQTADLWGQLNEEWKKNLTFEQLLEEIKPIKESFMQRMQIKWGPQFTFQEFLSLEHLYTNTIQSTGTTNPLTIDIVKKIAVISVMMEKALFEGDIKAAGEYSKMHKSLIEAAGLNDMIEVGESDVISTVSELCDYLEQNDFQFRFYDGVSRDIVDKTIADMQAWTRQFVLDTTGIQQTYELIEDTYKNKLEKEKSEQATSDVSLDELLEQTKQKFNADFDASLDEEDFMESIDSAEDPTESWKAPSGLD